MRMIGGVRRMMPARGEWRTLGLLIAGTALFAITLRYSPIRPAIVAMFVLTPLFGLPWLLFGPHDRIVVRALVVVLGFPLAHCLAVGAGLALAMSNRGFPFTPGGWTNSMAAAGAVSGVVGCGVSLMLCALAGLIRPGRRLAILLGTLLLGAVGAVALAAIDGNRSYLAVDAIWQSAFAYLLAKTLRT